MKKVLVLTYYWPPSGGAGVQRWLKFVKYMRGFGWEPVVYTADNAEMPVVDESLQKEVPAGTEVIKTPIWEPYSIYKKFIGRKKEDKINPSFLNENKKTGLAEKISVWIRGNFFIPDARRFWIKPSIAYLQKYITDNNIQYVISSGPPHSMHLIALGLKKKFPQLKWLADFRDPWTNIDFYEKLMLSAMANRRHHQLELNVLKNADVVLSIGTSMRDEFAQMYLKAFGQRSSKFKVITNGFDKQDTGNRHLDKDKKFSIAHIGTLVKDRNPDVLWRVLANLIKYNKTFEAQLEIKLVGKVDIFVNEQLEHYDLTRFVNKINYLPHDQVIEEQQKSKLLLLLVNNTKNAKGILTGKFFEYMASGSPVLAIGPEDGELADIIQKTGCGLMSGFTNENQLEKNIMAFFNGTVTQRNEQEINNYERSILTKHLCELLDQMC